MVTFEITLSDSINSEMHKMLKEIRLVDELHLSRDEYISHALEFYRIALIMELLDYHNFGFNFSEFEQQSELLVGFEDFAIL